jgi:hypothetical protein
MIAEPHRVSPSWVREHQGGENPAVLICGYDDEAKCRSIQIPGSLSLRELNDRLPSFGQDKELVFYCA